MTTNKQFLEIHKAALAAAAGAAAAKNAQLGPEGARGLDCGFAWVSIAPGNGAYVRALRAAGVGSKGYPSGWQLWGSSLHGEPTQSISVHEAAANAYATVARDALAAHNVRQDFSVGTRYD